MAKNLTFDELLQCARACEPEGGRLRDLADSTVKTLELVTANLVTAIAHELSVYYGDVEFGPKGIEEIQAKFFAKRIGQSCPTPLDQFGNSEWSLQSGKQLDPETGAELPVQSK